MMTDNNLKTLPNAVGTSTNDMTAFPDSTTAAGGTDKEYDPDGYAYEATTDKDGYILYGHDITGGAAADPNPDQTDVNYVAANTTSLYYTVDSAGTVSQHTTSGVTP